jgi:hypothetical protein
LAKSRALMAMCRHLFSSIRPVAFIGPLFFGILKFLFLKFLFGPNRFSKCAGELGRMPFCEKAYLMEGDPVAHGCMVNDSNRDTR